MNGWMDRPGIYIDNDFSLYRAVLTASLPKLEPFSPIDTKDFHFSHPTALQQNHTSSSASNTSEREITGTGREEFLKRQSMFTGGTPKEVESSNASSGLKRHSLDPSQTIDNKEDGSKVSVVVIDEENGEDSIVDNVSDDQDLPGKSNVFLSGPFIEVLI